jgi:hypothetical protein
MFLCARPNVTRVSDQPITSDDEVYLSWGTEAGAVLTR